MNNFSRNIMIWLIGAISLMMLFNVFNGNQSALEDVTIPYSDFVNHLNQGRVNDVVVKDWKISGHLNDGTAFATQSPVDFNLADRLLQKGVKVTAAPGDNESSIFKILLGSLPTLIIIGIWIFVLRQMNQGNNRAMGFGKSRAKRLDEKDVKVTFADVAGVDEAKEDVEEIVDFLKNPRKFEKIGAKIPKGVLLIGPPGTGKTLLAKAIAGEAKVPFLSISGSDFVEMFVGVGASRVRDMFEQARKNAPCIIFIDEIDAVGRHRGAGYGGGNDEREQTLNQLLVEMDGFEPHQGIIIIAATNRPDVLDKALLRPGRFDRQVVVSNPDLVGREKILAVHVRRIPLAPDVDLKLIARGTPGFSGADLANLVNEAALYAARNNKRLVTKDHFDYAKDKVMMGPERKSAVITELDKKITAYHEGGHALIAYHLRHVADPIHKATIIPRGRALGMVMQLPEVDKLNYTKEWLEARLVVYYGGRVAEELIFGSEKITTGASSDIQEATRIAEEMVTVYGMSDRVGPQKYKQEDDQRGFFPKNQAVLSDTMSQIIDEEIRSLLNKSYKMARDILKKNIKQLHLIAKNLLEYETLTGDDIHALLNGSSIATAKASATAADNGNVAPDYDAPKSRPKQRRVPRVEPQPE